MTYDKNKIPHLRAVPSKGDPGSFPGHAYADDTGAVVMVTAQKKRVTPCGGCQQVTVEGELITKYRRTWWHEDCANRDIEAGDGHSAWLALAHDAARSPRSYSVVELRAIIGAILAIAEVPADIDDEELDGTS